MDANYDYGEPFQLYAGPGDFALAFLYIVYATETKIDSSLFRIYPIVYTR